MHICINVYGGLQYSAECSFALHTFFCFFFPTPKTSDVCRSCMCWWLDNNLMACRNVSCDLKNRCTKHKRPTVDQKKLVFSIFFSLFDDNCGLSVHF